MMKVWYSFIKELKLSSKSFYFYIEMGVALVIMLVLLFAVPDQFTGKTTEYLYLDLAEPMYSYYVEMIEEGADIVETREVKVKGQTIVADYYESEEKKVYLLEDRQHVIDLAESKKNIGGVVKQNDQGELEYEYYLQGYETERLKNFYLIIHNESWETIEEVVDHQRVESLNTDVELLTDKQNVIPVVLTLNGSLMGMFIIAAYIFLDKSEGIIKAYAVTAAPVWNYLMSKIGVIIVTTLLSAVIIVPPIMGTQPSYGMMTLLLITTAFFSASLGLVIASFYSNIMQAFGVVYTLIIILGVPAVGYYIPSWDPTWLKVIPSYWMMDAFKETLLLDMNTVYVAMVSIGFLLAGVVLFVISNSRYKKTLTV